MPRPNRKDRLSDPLFKRAYKAWVRAKSRCNNPRNNRYSSYGAKGVIFCEKWNKFDNFLEDMGLPKQASMSIDRINNNGNYEPGNCRWATHLEQSMNKSTNRFLTINGESKTLSEWGRISGVGLKLLWNRLKDGWPEDENLLKPVRSHKPTESIEINGETLAQISRRTGLQYNTLYNRYMSGHRGERLTRPIQKRTTTPTS